MWIRTSCGTVTVCLAALTFLSLASGEELTEATFQRLHAELEPAPDEPWRTISWKIALLDAQQQAAREHQPIFIWAMDGHGQLTGAVQLETAREDRSYDAQVRGRNEVSQGKVTRLDVVALGDFHGRGPLTGHAPKGRFTLAIAFSLADGTDVADRIPPQGSRGWLPGYLGS